MSPIDQIRSYADYPVGWCYGRGGPANDNMISMAEQVLAGAVYQYDNIFICMSDCAEISITFHSRDFHLNFIIYHNSTVEYSLEYGYGQTLVILDEGEVHLQDLLKNPYYTIRLL